MKRLGIIAIILSINCDSYKVDTTPPAPPRGLYSVTGDRMVTLYWLPNTEDDLAGYRVYRNFEPYGYYEFIAETPVEYFVDDNVINGVTYYYAVSAFDEDNNESELSYELVFDTPRPEGFNVVLLDYERYPEDAGYDFSDEKIRPFDHPLTDIYYYYDDASYLHYMITGEGTDIQDFGYTESLDEINYAPIEGWAPSGVVELILYHSYIVWTWDNHFAKFRITDAGDGWVRFDWAYQIDEGNRELVVKKRQEALK